MELVSTANGLFTYSGVFNEFPQTNLAVPNIPELLWCNVTLESYNIGSCNMFPAAQSVSFNSISLACHNSAPTVNWQPDIIDAACGQGVDVLNNSADNGQVDLLLSAKVSVV